jgi:hypothetical protein
MAHWLKAQDPYLIQLCALAVPGGQKDLERFGVWIGHFNVRYSTSQPRTSLPGPTKRCLGCRGSHAIQDF